MGAPGQIATDQFECLTYEVAEHVATLTINRPQRRNALNRRAYAEVEAGFRAASADKDIRCLIITGSDPAFCSGEDVKEMMTGAEKDKSITRLTAVRPAPTPAAVAALECEVPVIAAINGPAVGWGMELTLFADIRIASERAQMGEIFIRRGLVSDVGGLWRLPSLVGPAKASELLFTGDVIDAAEAHRIGLVSKVVPHGELLVEARALATRIAANAPLALRYMKEGLRRTAYGNLDEIGGWVSQTLGTLFQTADHREGVASFLEKRAPRFTGN